MKGGQVVLKNKCAGACTSKYQLSIICRGCGINLCNSPSGNSSTKMLLSPVRSLQPASLDAGRVYVKLTGESSGTHGDCVVLID